MPSLEFDCAAVIAEILGSLGYRIHRKEVEEVIAQAFSGHPQYPGYRYEVNRKIAHTATQKYACRDGNFVEASRRQVHIVVPWRPRSATGLSCLVTPGPEGTRHLRIVATDEDFHWRVHFGRVLYKLCGNFRALAASVTINDQRLKTGEWFAAILFSLSGDEAGMIVTIDESLERSAS